MGFGWNDNGVAILVEFTGNLRRFGLGYEPTLTDVRRIALERRGRSMGRPQELQVKGVPLCQIDESFVSTGWMCDGWSRWMIHYSVLVLQRFESMCDWTIVVLANNGL